VRILLLILERSGYAVDMAGSGVIHHAYCGPYAWLPSQANASLSTRLRSLRRR